MKQIFLLALLVSTALAEEEIPINNEEQQIEAANFNQMNLLTRMRYSMMTNGMTPPKQAVEHYSLMRDEDFPIDYNLACSNTCNCRTYCVMYWWMPCTCACPPPCNNNGNQNNQNNNHNNNQNNRFPPIEWQPETQPPRVPIFPRFTTTTPTPIWNGRPEWINPPVNPPRWPNPEWINPVDPWNPNNHPTHPPHQRPPARPCSTPAPIQPPIWVNPINPWNPNNPNGHLTHPPQLRTTTPPPNWWNNNQRPNIPQPIIPLPEPIPNPNQPNWWNQQPIQNQPPNWWDQQPQQPNQNQPNWWQQPQIEAPCDDTCSCVPCTVIWVCPPACSASCCAARGFGKAETVDKVENKDVKPAELAEPQSKVETPFTNFPDYLKDIFIPGMI